MDNEIKKLNVKYSPNSSDNITLNQDQSSIVRKGPGGNLIFHEIKKEVTELDKYKYEITTQRNLRPEEDAKQDKEEELVVVVTRKRLVDGAGEETEFKARKDLAEQLSRHFPHDNGYNIGMIGITLVDNQKILLISFSGRPMEEEKNGVNARDGREKEWLSIDRFLKENTNYDIYNYVQEIRLVNSVNAAPEGTAVQYGYRTNRFDNSAVPYMCSEVTLASERAKIQQSGHWKEDTGENHFKVTEAGSVKEQDSCWTNCQPSKDVYKENLARKGSPERTSNYRP